MSHPRTLIVLGAGSEVEYCRELCRHKRRKLFLQCGDGVDRRVRCSGASLPIAKRRCRRRSTWERWRQRLGRGCHLTAHAITLSGALVRNDVHVSLDGEGAECVLNGLYLGADKQHIDNSTEIEHAKPRARSLELYKGILDDASHGVFNGKIVVHKDAQKSDARQTNRNLLLSGRRGGEHQAATRDLRRRCEVQPRLDDRPVGSRRLVLSALARARAGGSSESFELCVCQRHRRTYQSRRFAANGWTTIWRRKFRDN